MLCYFWMKISFFEHSTTHSPNSLNVSLFMCFDVLHDVPVRKIALCCTTYVASLSFIILGSGASTHGQQHSIESMRYSTRTLSKTPSEHVGCVSAGTSSLPHIVIANGNSLLTCAYMAGSQSGWQPLQINSWGVRYILVLM